MWGGITTNATLLSQSRMDHLVGCKFHRYQITLDGPRHIHNKRRLAIGGRGSFERIWRTLCMLKACPDPHLQVTLRIHFDEVSLPELIQTPGFFDHLTEQFLRDDSRFRLSFHPLENWGGRPTGVKFFSSSAAERRAIELLLAHVSGLGLDVSQVPQLQNSLLTGESGHAVCYAARANSFVIRADGRVSKCTVALDDDRNIVGHLSPNGDLVIDHDTHIPWLRGLVTGDPKSLACPAIGYIWKA